jgi:O-antigen/teichoic acid export membrane protein
MSSDSKVVSGAVRDASFFRQSGWLMIANIAGGALMWAVHLLAKAIPQGEYGNFGALLAVVMVVPTIPLQMVLAQQTAKALATNTERELSGVLRLMLAATGLIWLIGAILALIFQEPILNRMKVGDVRALYILLPIVLVSLWSPLLLGVLQGLQNFLWLGWSLLSNAIGRVLVAAFAVLVLHAYATGMVAGVLVGLTVAFLIAVWHTRVIWRLPTAPFDWRGLMRQVIPLTMGFLAFQVLFTVDTLFAKSYFSQADADFYVSAGTMARALMWLVLPLAAVMFPRLVHSAAKSEKNNLMSLVLAGTAILAIVSAAGLSLVGRWVIPIVYTPEYIATASAILPWYAFAIVPLAVANVLLSNLLARPTLDFVFPSCAVLVAVGYMVALTRFHASMIQVLQVMGICNLLFLAVCAGFSWKNRA